MVSPFYLKKGGSYKSFESVIAEKITDCNSELHFPTANHKNSLRENLKRCLC